MLKGTVKEIEQLAWDREWVSVREADGITEWLVATFRDENGEIVEEEVKTPQRVVVNVSQYGWIRKALYVYVGADGRIGWAYTNGEGPVDKRYDPNGTGIVVF